jgi:hypothetical protein
MFCGLGVSRTGETDAKLVGVARRAGVSTGAVSNVLNRPEVVAEPTRIRVLEAIEALGFTRGGGAVDQAWHWRRNGHITRERREELMANLTAEWEAALDARLAMCPTSSVAVLQRAVAGASEGSPVGAAGRGIPRSSPRFLPRGPGNHSEA